MRNVAALLVLMIAAFGVPAFALDAPIDEGLAVAADHDSYLTKTPGMLLHGVYDIAESPLEVVNKPYERTFDEKDHKFGLLRGMNRGVNSMLKGVTHGIFNIFRSFVPGMGRYEDPQKQDKIIPFA